MLVLSISGCCTFIPCHPATRSVGYITDLNGQPIEGATITLYGYKQITNANDCFHFNVADALPFTLSANATNFKSVEVPSKAGHYTIDVKLAPADSNDSSEISWREMSSEKYHSNKPCT